MPPPAGRTSCDHCGEPLSNRKYRYHPHCKDAAKTAALSGTRRCGRCRVEKQADRFSNDSTRPDGKFPWCMECQSRYMTERRWQDPEGLLNGHLCPLCDTPVRGHPNRRFCSAYCKERVNSLRNRFHLEVSQYRELVDAANGHCPICNEAVQVWHVDHNHRTGRVTGVICGSCNVGPVANTFHDIEFVKSLLSYLENPPADRLGIEAVAVAGAERPSQLHRMWDRQRSGERV